MKNLKPEVAAKYALIGIRPGKYNFKGFGEIDLSEVTIAKADSLVQNGFPHFKLRGAFNTAAPLSKANLKAKPLGGPAKTGNDQLGAITVEKLRENKQFINKLLVMDWKDLSYLDRLVFFGDQVYFLRKKSALLEISSIDGEMKSLHAKAKAIKPELKNKKELSEIMQSIATNEERKIKLWAEIDNWIDPPSDQVDIAKEAVAVAIEKDKQIRAHKIYILRAENVLADMPIKTAAQRGRLEHKTNEVARRKEELIKLGSPYSGKEK